MTYLDEIDLVEALVAPRSLDVQNRNDILMVEVAQQLHLTQSSQTEHGVVKGNDLLDCNLLTRGLVNRRTGSSQHLLSFSPRLVFFFFFI